MQNRQPAYKSAPGQPRFVAANANSAKSECSSGVRAILYRVVAPEPEDGTRSEIASLVKSSKSLARGAKLPGDCLLRVWGYGARMLVLRQTSHAKSVEIRVIGVGSLQYTDQASLLCAIVRIEPSGTTG